MSSGIYFLKAKKKAASFFSGLFYDRILYKVVQNWTHFKLCSGAVYTNHRQFYESIYKVLFVYMVKP